MRAEEKFLIAVYSKEVFEGGRIRQDPPVCCGREIDLYKTKVFFKEVSTFGRRYTLLEPVCPGCGIRIEATACTIH